MRRFLCTAFISLVFLNAGAVAQEKCDRAAFTAVVADASAQLTAMNTANKKSFQDKLQLLRAREAWPDAEYLAKASPFVKDERIAAFDETSQGLLASIQGLGSAPVTAGAAALLSSAEARQCAMLEELRGLMARVVDNTRAKWGYMLGKVDAATEASRQAVAVERK